MVSDLLHTLLENGVIRPLDFAFAEFVAERESVENPEVVMLAALLSRELGDQHICLNVMQLGQPFLPYYQFPDRAALEKKLRQASMVWMPSLQKEAKPIVWDNGGVYLHKYWQYEKRLAELLIERSYQQREFESSVLENLLHRLFPAPQDGDIDWQKVAVCLAAKRKLSIITGGPGTGKTTTVARLLAVLLGIAREQQQSVNIQLVAPTGKAAARLSESIQHAKTQLPDDLQQDLATQCSTIHRLLGSIPNRVQFKHNKHNKLHLDLLIVDEASMIDLPLMCKLFEALPAHAAVVLLGDKDQLSSVEAGSVLSDICSAVSLLQGYPDYSKATHQYLRQFCPLPRSQPDLEGQSALQDNLAILQKSHRFSGDSGIGNLAKAFNKGDVVSAIACLNDAKYQDLAWSDSVGVAKLLADLIPHYRRYQSAVNQGDLSTAFSVLQQQQVLCAQRSGPFGVDEINQLVEKELSKQQLIDLSQEYYIGRPVMLTQNDHQLGVFNGDIGIVMPDPDKPLLRKVWFIREDGNMYGVLPNRIPAHNTQYAMTIHKSQGSEFDHVTMLLSPLDSANASRGLSRELLYTGLTRARKHFHLVADKASLSAALSKKCERSSGLQERLI